MSLARFGPRMPSNLFKAGANWVDGDRFFDRESELDLLRDRAEEGTHTLLTAQRRMGKTSLVREFLRRLEESSSFSTVFVDLEDAEGPADAVAEIAFQAKSVKGTWTRVLDTFANHVRSVRDHIDEVGVADLRIKLRAGVDSGNWHDRGDQVFEALANGDDRVVLAIDELPILVNRILKGGDFEVTPERRATADQFLSWLRRNGQAHRGRIILITLGSISLEPVLRQANLSAQMNIFSTFDLKPWDKDTALQCLQALSDTYALDLPIPVAAAMCDRLRCCVPHHVQRYFDYLHEHLRRQGRTRADLSDVTQVYNQDLLAIRGQIDLDHYESRLRLTLSPAEFEIALELLTDAAVHEGHLSYEAVTRLEGAIALSPDSDPGSVKNILFALEHDGYLEADGQGYRYVSGLLEDWWRARHGQFFVPRAARQ